MFHFPFQNSTEFGKQFASPSSQNERQALIQDIEALGRTNIQQIFLNNVIEYIKGVTATHSSPVIYPVPEQITSLTSLLLFILC